MQIFVRGDTTQVVACDPWETIDAVKQRVDGLAASANHLIFAGRCLSESMTIAECGLEDESTIIVSGGLLGGGKKRKKKVYTTPKKIKHKKKKIKLAVLKFYKVDGGDKVQRLRKECPNETCGPGVFMAMHFNRYYCGRCGLTYLIKQDDA